MSFDFDFIILGIVQIFSFFVEGAAGFGCTVISAPFATGILGVKEGIPFGTLIALPFITVLAVKSRKNISWKSLGRIFAACLPGFLLGQYLYVIVNPEVAKIAIGSAVTLIALYKIYENILNPPVKKSSGIFRISCLVVGGIVHGAFNIGGPLITVYTLEAVKDKTRFRNTMVALWTVLNFMNAINQFRNNGFTAHLGSAVLVCIPFAMIGFILGIKFLEKINRNQFLKFVYIVLLAVGLNMVIRSILEIL